MRRWHKPPYFLAKLAKPRCVSWSIMSILPMMGQPRGPGGYGSLRRREMSPMKMKSETAMRSAVVGSNTWPSVCDIENSILVFFFLLNVFFLWSWKVLGIDIRQKSPLWDVIREVGFIIKMWSHLLTYIFLVELNFRRFICVYQTDFVFTIWKQIVYQTDFFFFIIRK